MRSYESYFVPPALRASVECWNIHQCHIILLKALVDNALLVAAWSATRSSPVCSCRVKLEDDSGSMVIRLLQGMTKLVNTLKDVQLDGPLGELLIGHKI